MDRPLSERRRLLTLLTFAALAVPAAALAGCASGGTQPPPDRDRLPIAIAENMKAGT